MVAMRFCVITTRGIAVEIDVAKTTVGFKQSQWWRMKYLQDICFKSKRPSLLHLYSTLKAKQVFALKCFT